MEEDQIFDPAERNQLEQNLNHEEPNVKGYLSNKRIIAAIVVGVLLVGGVFWYFLAPNSLRTQINSDKVVLLIKAPDQLTSGNEAEYRIIYRNGENADLVGLSLDIIYPSDFRFRSASKTANNSAGTSFTLPVLKEGNDGELIIRGKLSGSTGSDKELKAILHYKLSNFNSEFAVETTHKTIILAPNLIMDVAGPIEVTGGQDTTFSLTFTNVSTQEFENLAIQVNYPTGFKFTSANPPANRNNNYWTIPKLALGQNGRIEITGSFTGAAAEEKLVTAEMGQIISNSFAPMLNASGSFKIAAPTLSLTQTASPANHVDLGENIEFNLNYGNKGSIGMTNVQITVVLEGQALDFTRLQVNDAIVVGNTITWKAATFSHLGLLSPNEEGEIRFDIPIKNSFTTNIENQMIKSTATISSAEVTKPIRANDVEVKVASKLGLSLTGDYLSGPMPMQVGQTTTFAITMLLTNGSNDLENTEVIASMPLPSSAWKNVIIPDAEKNRLSYDPNSGKIRWKIGALDAFTGKYSLALKVTFQLAVTPTEADRGRTMMLLREVTPSGFDRFIEQKIETDVISEVSVSDLGDDVIDFRGSSVE